MTSKLSKVHDGCAIVITRGDSSVSAAMLTVADYADFDRFSISFFTSGLTSPASSVRKPQGNGINTSAGYGIFRTHVKARVVLLLDVRRVVSMVSPAETGARNQRDIL